VPTHADELTPGATGSSLDTQRLLGVGLSKKYPDTKVTVMCSLGYSDAIKAVPKGVLDIGVASGELTDEERRPNLTATEYALTPAAIAVSSKSGVTEIAREQRADFLTGKLGKWPDGLVIHPVLRQPGDKNSRQLRDLSTTIEAALAVAERRHGCHEVLLGAIHPQCIRRHFLRFEFFGGMTARQGIAVAQLRVLTQVDG